MTGRRFAEDITPRFVIGSAWGSRIRHTRDCRSPGIVGDRAGPAQLACICRGESCGGPENGPLGHVDRLQTAYLNNVPCSGAREDSMDLPRHVNKRQSTTRSASADRAVHDHVHARGVHERQLLQIELDAWAVELGSLPRLLELE
jgi:hypothetical protein